MIPLASLVLAAALAQAPATAAPDPGGAPDGTPEDQSLWRELRAAANLTTVSMGRIAQCSFRIGYGRYYEELDAILRDGPEAVRPEARALRDAVAREAKAADEALPDRPGLRECQYALRDLGLQMPLLSEPSASKGIVKSREQARACVKKLRPLGERLSAHADALDAALAAVDDFEVRRSAAAPAAREAKDRAAAAPADPAAKEAKP